jgi:hypothetical protein
VAVRVRRGHVQSTYHLTQRTRGIGLAVG